MKYIALLLCCLFSLQLNAQIPSIKIRAVNCFMIMHALNRLDVPLYLDTPVNSSRTYYWYRAKTSFGVTAKASDTPWNSVDCRYNQGRLTSFKWGKNTYSITWDGDYIVRITAYDKDGSILISDSCFPDRRIDFGIRDLLSSREPKRFGHEFTYLPDKQGWGSVYDEMGFFISINHHPSKREVRGNFFSYSTTFDDIASLCDMFTYYHFLIKTKGVGGFSKSYLEEWEAWKTFFCDKQGRCYMDGQYGTNTLHFSKEFIEEVNVNY